jgi:hypothetical protein
MKTKNFKIYLKNRLSKEEIADIEKQALLEKEALLSLQNDIAIIINNYMVKENIGFNELVRRLESSAVQVSKIQKGKANLTMASIAHIFALLKKKPRIATR